MKKWVSGSLYSVCSSNASRASPSGISASAKRKGQLGALSSIRTKLTRTGNKLLVQLVREERHRQAPEEVLEARSDGGEIVELVEILEVKILAALEKLGDELGLTHASRLAVDAFVLHACSGGMRTVSQRERDDEPKRTNRRLQRRRCTWKRRAGLRDLQLGLERSVESANEISDEGRESGAGEKERTRSLPNMTGLCEMMVRVSSCA